MLINNPFEVICNACRDGLGVLLVQRGRPIAIEGEHMKEAEQKYTTGEQELLAMVHALQLWRCHSDELVITIVTDHSPTTFIQTKAVLSPRQEMLSRFSSH